MSLNLSILPSSQRRLWDELHTTPDHFTLYGGTAIALQLGHRQSIDFDFFTPQSFDPHRLYTQIPYLREAEIMQLDNNALTCLVDRDGPVMLSFFGGLDFPIIEPPIEDIIRIAGLRDAAGMKAAVIQKRAEQKDYLDIYALLQHGISLPAMFDAAKLLYQDAFNAQITLKALVYFEEGDVPALPQEVKQYLQQAVRAVQL